MNPNLTCLARLARSYRHMLHSCTDLHAVWRIYLIIFAACPAKNTSSSSARASFASTAGRKLPDVATSVDSSVRAAAAHDPRIGIASRL